MGSRLSQPIPTNFGKSSEVANVINFVHFRIDRLRDIRFGEYMEFLMLQQENEVALNSLLMCSTLPRLHVMHVYGSNSNN